MLTEAAYGEAQQAFEAILNGVAEPRKAGPIRILHELVSETLQQDGHDAGKLGQPSVRRFFQQILHFQLHHRKAKLVIRFVVQTATVFMDEERGVHGRGLVFGERGDESEVAGDEIVGERHV